MIEQDAIQPLMEELDLSRRMTDESLDAAFPVERLMSQMASSRPPSAARGRGAWRFGPSRLALAAAALTVSVLGGVFIGTEVAANSSSLSYAVPEAQVRGQLEVALKRSYPQQYAGTAFADRGRRLEIYMTSLPPSLQSRVSYYVPLSMVDFRVVQHSVTDLNSVANRIASDFPTLLAQGIEVASIQSDFASSTVIVDVVNATQSDINILNDDYGAANLTIQSVPPSAVSGTNGALITKEPTSAS